MSSSTSTSTNRRGKKRMQEPQMMKPQPRQQNQNPPLPTPYYAPSEPTDPQDTQSLLDILAKSVNIENRAEQEIQHHRNMISSSRSASRSPVSVVPHQPCFTTSMQSQADEDGSSASGGAAAALATRSAAHQQVKSSQELQQVNHYGQVVHVRGTSSRKSPRRGGGGNKNKKSNTSNFNSKPNSTTQGQELVQNANLFPSSSWGSRSGSAVTNSGSSRVYSSQMNTLDPTVQGGRPRTVHQRPPFVLGQKGRPVGAGVAKNTIGVNSSLSGKIGGDDDEENEKELYEDADFSPPPAMPDFVADVEGAKMKNDTVFFPSPHNDDENEINHANEPNFTTERRDSCRRSLKFFAGTKEILNPNSEDRNSSVNEDFTPLNNLDGIGEGMFDTTADRFAADVKPTGQHAEEDEVPNNIVYHYAGQQRHANTSRTSRASRVSGRSSGQLHQTVSRTPDSSRGQQQDVFDNQIGSDQPTMQDDLNSNYNPNASRDYSFDSPEVDVDEDAVYCAAGAAPGGGQEHVDVDVDPHGYNSINEDDDNEIDMKNQSFGSDVEHHVISTPYYTRSNFDENSVMLESVNNFKSEQVVARSKGAATDGSVGSNKTSSIPHLVENDAKQCSSTTRETAPLSGSLRDVVIGGVTNSGGPALFRGAPGGLRLGLPPLLSEKAMLNASSNTSASRPGSPGKQLMLSAREYNTPKILSPSLNHLQLRPNFIPPSSCSKKSETVSPTLAGMTSSNAGGVAVDAQHSSQHQQQYYYEAADVPPPHQHSQYTTPALQIPIPGSGCDTTTSPTLTGPAPAAAHPDPTVVATNQPHLLVEQAASLAHTLSSSQMEHQTQSVNDTSFSSSITRLKVISELQETKKRCEDLEHTLYTARSQCEDLVLENERLREQVSQQSYSYQIRGEQENNENRHDGTCYSSPVVSQDGVILRETNGSTSRERQYPAGSISNSSCSPDAGPAGDQQHHEHQYYTKVGDLNPHHQEFFTTQIQSAGAGAVSQHRTIVPSNRPSFYNSVRIQHHHQNSLPVSKMMNPSCHEETYHQMRLQGYYWTLLFRKIADKTLDRTEEILLKNWKLLQDEAENFPSDTEIQVLSFLELDDNSKDSFKRNFTKFYIRFMLRSGFAVGKKVKVLKGEIGERGRVLKEQILTLQMDRNEAKKLLKKAVSNCSSSSSSTMLSAFFPFTTTSETTASKSSSTAGTGGWTSTTVLASSKSSSLVTALNDVAGAPPGVDLVSDDHRAVCDAEPERGEAERTLVKQEEDRRLMGTDHSHSSGVMLSSSDQKATVICSTATSPTSTGQELMKVAMLKAKFGSRSGLAEFLVKKPLKITFVEAPKFAINCVLFFPRFYWRCGNEVVAWVVGSG
ncbi:unnamed protein product [Amoebophrya sp. A120]|nr:unnamed protein product [Amoebophrya sp. A120]|eukprot:GSA120T00023921001.1